ncbi:MAG: beta strand repeat-containing protein [Miltoncostaeaceae bacterium]
MRTTRLAAWSVAGAGALALTTALALGALPQQSGTVDLLTQANITIAGAETNAQTGKAVAGAGDVNADGIDDVIIGAAKADPFGRTDAGAAYVVFGSATATSIDLAALGANGFRIAGAANLDEAGNSVAGAGDVNHDGIDDVIVGARYADPGAVSNAGTATVIFGSASATGDVDLAALGTRGFEITGAAVGDYTGWSVAAAGDVNHDGIDDVIVGVSGADPASRGNAGSGVVIYGSNSPTTFSLTSLGARGFRINGYATFVDIGYAVGGAGDFNGDGIDDVIVASYAAPPSPDVNWWSGVTYVIYGSNSPTDVTTNALGSRGIAITGAAQEDQSGYAVAGVGDQNGDGKADIVIGAPGADPAAGSAAGSSYVVYGSTSPTSFNLGTFGGRGFRINGAAFNDQSGTSVAAAGDVNGDGLPDMIIGAPAADPSSRNAAGTSYVVYGRATPTDVALATLGQGGIVIQGAAANDFNGQSVSGAGDVNGDGRDDVLTGSYGADPSSLFTAGTAYVTFGFGTSSLAYPSAVAGTVGTAITPVSPTVARTGAATFAVSSPLPSGLTLDASTGVISGTPTVVSPSSPYTVTMTDVNGQTTTSVQIGVVAAPPTPPAPAPAPEPTENPAASSPGATPASAPDTPTAEMRVQGDPTVTGQQGSTAVVTHITVNGPGELAQQGQAQAVGTVGRPLQACASSKKIVRPGTYVVTCRLSSASRRLLSQRSLRVRLFTSFTATDGSRAERISVVRVARTHQRAVPVTG